ncbi:MAG: hypothetical protein ACRCSP_00275 [Rhodoglobus sp.]
MVKQFLRLKLSLVINTFRRTPLQLAGMVLVLLWGLGLSVLAVSILVALRSSTPDIARVVVVSCGTLVMLAFFLLPLVFGADDTIDPRRSAAFGIPPNTLATSIAVASAMSLPTLMVTILSIAQVATWSRGPLPMCVAIISAILIVPTCVLGSRVTTALAAIFLSSHRARDVVGIFFMLALVIAALILAFLSTVDWQSQGLPIMRRLAAVTDWTPLGSAWSAPGDVALGFGGQAALKLLISAGFVVGLWYAWRGLVRLMLVRSDREDRGRRRHSLGWFDRLPATPGGVIAARSLSYWGRDSRYRVSSAVIPVVPVVMVAILAVAGVPADIIAWVPLPVMCLFLGWAVHNDVAHDGSALWIHVSSSTRGVDDRWGRIAPALLFGVPLIGIGALMTALIVGNISMLPGVIGVSLCILLVGLGISSVISVKFPYPAVHPGDNPFAQPQAVGSTASLVQCVSLLATIVITLPVVLLATLPAADAGNVGGWLALIVGILIGSTVLVAGVLWGARILSARGPELLSFALRN